MKKETSEEDFRDNIKAEAKEESHVLSVKDVHNLEERIDAKTRNIIRRVEPTRGKEAENDDLKDDLDNVKGKYKKHSNTMHRFEPKQGKEAKEFAQASVDDPEGDLGIVDLEHQQGVDLKHQHEMSLNAGQIGAVAIEGIGTTGESTENFANSPSEQPTNEPSLEKLPEIEATLVDELSPETRQKIEEETREKIMGEIGKLVTAEAVPEQEKNYQKKICLGIAMIVVVIAVIVWAVVGTRDDSNDKSSQEIFVGENRNIPTAVPTTAGPTTLRPSAAPSQIPTSRPLDNNKCEEAHTLVENTGPIVGYMINATIYQAVNLCSGTGSFEDSRGLYYRYVGKGNPVRVEVRGKFSMEIYKECDSLCEDIENSIIYYQGGAAWTALDSVEYVMLVHEGWPYAGWEGDGRFELTIVDNDECENAFGPVEPSATTFLTGSTDSGQTIDVISTNCGSPELNSPGVWYQVRGNGRLITATTCTATSFDAALKIFSGTCTALNCIETAKINCGVAWSSENDVLYYVLVYGNQAFGRFALQINTDQQTDGLVPGDICLTAIELSKGVTRQIDSELDRATEEEDGPSCVSDGSIKRTGLWYRIVGDGEPILLSLAYYENWFDGSNLGIIILSGSNCGSLTCLMNVCDYYSNYPLSFECALDSIIGETYYVYIGVLNGPRPTGTGRLDLSVNNNSRSAISSEFPSSTVPSSVPGLF